MTSRIHTNFHDDVTGYRCPNILSLYTLYAPNFNAQLGQVLTCANEPFKIAQHEMPAYLRTCLYFAIGVIYLIGLVDSAKTLQNTSKNAKTRVSHVTIFQRCPARYFQLYIESRQSLRNDKVHICTLTL